MSKNIEKGDFFQIISSSSNGKTDFTAFLDFNIEEELKNFITELSGVTVDGKVVAYQIENCRFPLETSKEELFTSYREMVQEQIPAGFENYLINKGLMKEVKGYQFFDIHDICNSLNDECFIILESK